MDSDFLDDVELLESWDENWKKLKYSLDYLNNFKTPTELTSNKTSLKAALFLNKLSNSKNFQKMLREPKLVNEFKFDLLLSKIFQNCYEGCQHFVNNNEFLKNDDKISKKDSKIKFYFIYYLTDVINYLTRKSKIFSSEFHRQSGTKALLEYLSNDFVKNGLNLKYDDKSRVKIGVNLVESVVRCIRNISEHSDEINKERDELHIKQCLINLTGHTKKYPNILILSYLTIVSVTNEKDMQYLSSIQSIIKEIVDLIGFYTKKMAKRKKLIPDDIDNSEAEYAYNQVHINLIELLESLNNIAASDSMKYKIYQEHGLKNHLSLIMKYGDELEKQYATKLLWQLCFDREVCQKINGDNEIVESLNHLSSDSDEFLRRNVVGIFWISKLISNNSDQVELKMGSHSGVTYNKSDSKEEHVMISYNKESRDLCLQIKEELERDGHKIWIDVQDIRGSSLESMAKAIENSKCVLMCMTEKYKQSPNCRAEAEYAFNIRKPIIPLLMQKNYAPDGWLGIILGTKIFVNFSKYPFDECIKRLKLEIDEQICEDKKIAAKSESVPNKINESDKSLENWTNEDVKEWLIESDIHVDIASQFNHFDGELLTQLIKVYKTSPEYFYSSINKDGKKIKNLIHYSSVNKTSAIETKNVNSSKRNFCLATLKTRVTKKLSGEHPEPDIENELRVQIEQISSDGNLYKLINSETRLEKALNFYKCLTNEILGNYTLISMLTYPETIYNYKLLLAMLKDGTKTYFKELNGKLLNYHHYSFVDNDKKNCKRKAQMFMTLTQMFATLSYYSKVFRKLFVSNHANCILEVISDKNVLLDCINIINQDKVWSKEVSNFLKNSIELIDNLKKTVRIDTRRLDKVCLAIMKLSKKTDHHLIASYMYISKYSNIPDTFSRNLFIDHLFLEIEIAISCMKSIKSFPIYFDSSRKAPISLALGKDFYLNLIQLLDTLFFLMNDEENEAIVQKNDFQRCMKNILMIGNDHEAEYAARILFQMSFFKDFKLEDEAILNIVKKVIIYQYPNKNLIRYCEGIVWMIEKGKVIEKLNSLGIKATSKRKVYICYDFDSFKVCSELSNILKSNEFLVWFKHVDDYSMEESLLAIKTSDIVLLGMCLFLFV
ncbi:hypothetical protein BpHYR1_008771 [Brachionus plicatilis]|uniref:TIR domain-containing protein n=1 Tax=Brachionus plicatilis TaxID=10195 RepID=A0A3M7PBN9_BRAPC|nr:hypothetical protein BpHYR1_008771 [Brachionus plicatilis]